MLSKRRLAFLAWNSAAALAGATFTLALLRSGADDKPAVSQPRSAAVAAPAMPQAHRFAFVLPGTLSMTAPPSVEPQLRPSIAPETEAAVPWSTEIRPEARLASAAYALLPPLTVPGETRQPRRPLRSYTLKARLAEIAPAASLRLAKRFETAKAHWPPAEIALLAIKDEKVLELHARATGGPWKLVHRYRVLAASGGLGPKLRQGDRQVPEGIYSVAFLNPNSAYHVSLRVNYPNAFDRQMAAKDGRKDLGGDIMIHGKNLSAGCLAMGDEAVEEIFVLAAQTGLPNVKLIIAPTDLRQNPVPAAEPDKPEWLPKLYAEVASAMSEFKQPPSMGLLSFFMK
jgi:hypothetical protein